MQYFCMQRIYTEILLKIQESVFVVSVCFARNFGFLIMTTFSQTKCGMWLVHKIQVCVCVCVCVCVYVLIDCRGKRSRNVAGIMHNCQKNIYKQESSPAWPQEAYCRRSILSVAWKDVPLFWSWSGGGRRGGEVPLSKDLTVLETGTSHLTGLNESQDIFRYTIRSRFIRIPRTVNIDLHQWQVLITSFILKLETVPGTP